MSFSSERERNSTGQFIKPSKPSIFDIREYRKKYHQKNRLKKISAAVEWARNNKERRKIINDRWRAKNKERTSFLSRRYNYRKKNAEGNHSFEQISKMYKDIKVCPYCRINISNTIDHVNPLSRGGTNDISNLMPCCVNCNSKKGAKTLWEWNPMLAYELSSIYA